MALADVLHSGLERRQAVTQVILGGVTEVKVLDVAQIRHPERGSNSATINPLPFRSIN